MNRPLKQYASQTNNLLWAQFQIQLNSDFSNTLMNKFWQKHHDQPFYQIEAHLYE